MVRFRLVFVGLAGLGLLSGCGRAALSAKAAGYAAPEAPDSVTSAGFAAEAAPTPEPAGGMAERSAPSAAPMSAAASASGSASRVAEVAPSEMLDIEAHIALLVANMSDARERLRKQANAQGGTVTSDVVQEDGAPRQASLTIRVPARASADFLTALEGLGEVTARQLTAKDIGREFHDSEIVLHNLERTLARYEEILQKAQSVEEILKIEAELSRIRGEIDRVKGALRYLGDRAARATLYVVLRERTQEIAEAEPDVVKFYPGLRAVALTQLRAQRSTVSAFGGGAVVGQGRTVNLELDALKRAGSESNSFDVVLVTLGGDAYSDFLGGGKRRFLNPYLGLRAGYARITGANDFVAGVTVGVELWKNRYVTIDSDLRALGLFGKAGSELGLQPTLGANVAF